MTGPELFRMAAEGTLASMAPQATVGNFALALVIGWMASDLWGHFPIFRRVVVLTLAGLGAAAILSPETAGGLAMGLLHEGHERGLVSGLVLAVPLRALWQASLRGLSR